LKVKQLVLFCCPTWTLISLWADLTS
jgi:hypothetical protein